MWQQEVGGHIYIYHCCSPRRPICPSYLDLVVSAHGVACRRGADLGPLQRLQRRLAHTRILGVTAVALWDRKRRGRGYKERASDAGTYSRADTNTGAYALLSPCFPCQSSSWAFPSHRPVGGLVKCSWHSVSHGLTAHPATVLGSWSRGLLDAAWDLLGDLL